MYHPIPYSDEDQRRETQPRWQLPAEAWRMQPKIKTVNGKACISNQITIIKYGHYCVDRLLRVEGTDENGETGFYEKDMKEVEWHFHRTGEKLVGAILENKPYDSSAETPGDGEKAGYAGTMRPNWTIMVPDFHCYCTPSHLKAILADRNEIDLFLHSVGTVQVPIRREAMMSEIVRTVMTIAGWLLIRFFAGISIVQKFLPDMLFGVVSLRNRYGRNRGNILFFCRNLAFLVPGLLFLLLWSRLYNAP